MEVKSAARRTDVKNWAICSYWLAGRCNRNPCRFMHGKNSTPQSFWPCLQKQSRSLTWKNPRYNPKIVSVPKGSECGDENATPAASRKPSSKSVYKYWVQGHCVDGKECRHMHSWFNGDEFSTLANLQGHKKVFQVESESPMEAPFIGLLSEEYNEIPWGLRLAAWKSLK